MITKQDILNQLNNLEAKCIELKKCNLKLLKANEILTQQNNQLSIDCKKQDEVIRSLQSPQNINNDVSDFSDEVEKKIREIDGL